MCNSCMQELHKKCTCNHSLTVPPSPTQQYEPLLGSSVEWPIRSPRICIFVAVAAVATVVTLLVLSLVANAILIVILCRIRNDAKRHETTDAATYEDLKVRSRHFTVIRKIHIGAFRDLEIDEKYIDRAHLRMHWLAVK